MEESFKIDTDDGLYKIYGLKNYTEGKKKSAIFIVHGMAGHVYEYHIKSAAEFFEKDYDVYRIHFYTGNKDARKLMDTGLDINAADINTVAKHVGADYEKLFFIGHSFGGPAVLIAKPEKTAAVSLWDPSFAMETFHSENWEKVTYEGKERIVMPMGNHLLIGEEMLADVQHLTRENCLKLAESFPYPIQVVHGTKDMYSRHAESYNSAGNKLNVREFIENAKHNFANEHYCDELLARTKAWFDKF